MLTHIQAKTKNKKKLFNNCSFDVVVLQKRQNSSNITCSIIVAISSKRFSFVFVNRDYSHLFLHDNSRVPSFFESPIHTQQPPWASVAITILIYSAAITEYAFMQGVNLNHLLAMYVFRSMHLHMLAKSYVHPTCLARLS